MTKYQLTFPDGFDDRAAELSSQGCFAGARLWCDGREFAMTFYDPARLAQEIERELARGILFFEPNLVVVAEITREKMASAVARLVESGLVDSLRPE